MTLKEMLKVILVAYFEHPIVLIFIGNKCELGIIHF